jgi:YfiH family protein
LLQSPLLKSLSWLAHAFTTRLGGESPSPLDSFNLGRHWNTDESKHDALRNRRILCKALDLNADRLAVPGQQHTNNVQLIKELLPESKEPSHIPAIDALSTRLQGQPLLLHFADCVPVMLVDTAKKSFSVIHAGWRGTASGIVKKSVELMVKELNSDPSDIFAAVGPAIGACCYRTGSEVEEKLLATVEDGKELIEHREGHIYPDIQAFNAMQLMECGVKHIDVSSWCTACHPELFYSHRQSGGQTGRQGALACLI